MKCVLCLFTGNNHLRPGSIWCIQSPFSPPPPLNCTVDHTNAITLLFPSSSFAYSLLISYCDLVKELSHWLSSVQLQRERQSSCLSYSKKRAGGRWLCQAETTIHHNTYTDEWMLSAIINQKSASMLLLLCICSCNFSVQNAYSQAEADIGTKVLQQYFSKRHKGEKLILKIHRP